jgi:hypothetical protein
LKAWESHIIDGEEYLTTKAVTLKGKEYQELKSANIMKPSTKYAEIVDGKLVLGHFLRTIYKVCDVY